MFLNVWLVKMLLSEEKLRSWYIVPMKKKKKIKPKPPNHRRFHERRATQRARATASSSRSPPTYSRYHSVPTHGCSTFCWSRKINCCFRRGDEQKTRYPSCRPKKSKNY